MNIAEKMKRDWDQRAQHHARFWIATENYQTEEVFAQSGQDTAQVLLKALTGLHLTWCILMWPFNTCPVQFLNNI